VKNGIDNEPGNGEKVTAGHQSLKRKKERGE
jgi:hypothetical protein